MTEAEPEHLMVERVGLVSTLVEEHKHGGGSREEKDLALIIIIILQSGPLSLVEIRRDTLL